MSRARLSVSLVTTVPGDAVSVSVRRTSVPVTTISPELCSSCGICAGACPSSSPFRRRSPLASGIDLPQRTVATLRVPNRFMLDWIRACKGGDPSCSDFSITVPYAEWLALAAIAMRLAEGAVASAVAGAVPGMRPTAARTVG